MQEAPRTLSRLLLPKWLRLGWISLYMDEDHFILGSTNISCKVHWGPFLGYVLQWPSSACIDLLLGQGVIHLQLESHLMWGALGSLCGLSPLVARVGLCWPHIWMMSCSSLAILASCVRSIGIPLWVIHSNGLGRPMLTSHSIEELFIFSLTCIACEEHRGPSPGYPF